MLDALRTGAATRGGPLPAGGPDTVAARVADATGEILPDLGEPEALRVLVTALAEGAADPAHPLCAAHLHGPPLAVAAAADLAASVLNPSLDSWDQAPAASALETLVTRTLARETGAADALVTTGGTESNQLAVLLAREAHGAGLRLIHGANAHHSVPRAAWLLGLPEPVVVPAPAGTLDPAALDEALTQVPGPHLVVATAGTTDAGLIDPLPEIADRCAAHDARLHVDAAYGAGLLFSDRHRPKLAGLDAAHTVALDLHKLGWQPIAAGLLTVVADAADLAALHHRAHYLPTPATTPTPDSPTSSAAPRAPAAAPTSSKSPSPSKPSDAAASAHSSTTSAFSPNGSPPSSTTTPTSNCTPRPPSAPCCSDPPTPPTKPSPPYAAPCSPPAAPSSAAPAPTAGSGSRRPCSTPTPGPTTWPPS